MSPAVVPLALPASLRAEYPFEGRHVRVRAGRMHVLDEGPRGTDPILFLHGNPTWSFLWRKVVLALRASQRCVAPDHLGCGLSERPSGWHGDLAGHADNLLELCDELGLERITLAVHDWGGAIGLALAARAPDRIARLLITNTAAFPGRMPLRIALCRAPVLGPILVERMNAFAGLLPRYGLADRTRLSADARAGYALPYEKREQRRAIRRFVEDIPTSPRHPSWDELARAGAALDAFAAKPAAIVWGERDWCFTPRFRAEWQRRLPRAAVRKLDDVGHLVPEEAPVEVVTALRGLLAEPVPAR